MARGRPTKGANHVEKLDGDTKAKDRLRVILQTFTGELTVREAIEQLGISESRFHALRDEFLRGGLEALAPKPSGRPARESDPLTEENELLKERIKELEMDLQVSRVRTELALVMPNVVENALEKEKKQAKAKRKKRPKPQRPSNKKKRKAKRGC